jgi:outer membrane lipoprotein-sorting protein
MTPGPGRFSLGTGLSPTVYGRRMNELRHVLILPLLLVSLASVPPSLDGQDGQAYQVLYAASDRYYGVETLCARFHQIVELTLLRQTVSSEGTVCLRQPDRFSMRFTDPEGDLVVVDGEFAWTFYPSQDAMQVMRFSAESAGGGFNFFENLLEDPYGRFEAVHEGRERMGEGMSHKITLTPRETVGLRPAGFRSAVVWFDVDGYLITAVDIHDTNESIRKLRLSDIEVDIDLPDELFRFVPPDGARVMTPPEGARVTPG